MNTTQLAHSGDTFSCTETSCTINPTELEAYHEAHHATPYSGMMAGMNGLGFMNGSTATTALVTGWITWILFIILLGSAIRLLWKLGNKQK